MEVYWSAWGHIKIMSIEWILDGEIINSFLQVHGNGSFFPLLTDDEVDHVWGISTHRVTLNLLLMDVSETSGYNLTLSAEDM